MIFGIEKYQSLLKDTLVGFLAEEDQVKVTEASEVISFDKGQRVQKEDQPQFLYILLEGEATLRQKNGVDVARGKPGRSFELKVLLLKEKTWQFDWVCEQKSIFLRIPWTVYEAGLMKNPTIYQYLGRISQSVALQRLKRDLVGLNVSRKAVMEIIASMHQESIDNIFSDWNRKIFFTLFQGEVLASVRFNDQKYKVANLQSGDTSFLDLQSTNLIYEADDNCRAWTLFESEWEKFTYKDEFKTFLEVFQFHNKNLLSPEETQATKTYMKLNKKGKKRTEEKLMIHDYQQSFMGMFKWIKYKSFPPKVFGSRDENRTVISLLSSLTAYYRKPMGFQRINDKIQSLSTSQSLEGVAAAAQLLGFRTSFLNTMDMPSDHQQWPCVVALDIGFFIIFARNETSALIGNPDAGEVSVISIRKLQKRMREKRVLLVEPTSKLKKAEDPPVPLFRYIAILARKPYMILLYFLAGLSAFFFDLSIPVLNQYLFDAVISEKNTKLLYPTIAAILAFTIFSNFLSNFNQKLLNSISTNFNLYIKIFFQNRLFRLPSLYVKSFGVSGMLTRFLDIDQLGSFFANSLLQAFLSLFLMVGSLSVLWLYHPTLIIISLAFIPFEVAFVQFVKGRVVDNRLEANQLRARENRMIVEHFTSNEDMKTLKGQLTSRWKWELNSNQSARNMLRSGFTNSSFQVVHFLMSELVKIACFLAAVRFYLNGEMTLGQVVGTSLLAQKVSQPVQNLVSTYFQYYSIKPILTRINDLTFGPAEDSLGNHKKKLEHVKGEITFSKVNFSYDTSSNRRALNDLSFQIKPGQKVAIIGPSGSGKSSIAGLLNGIYVPNSGQIQIDKVDIAEIDLESLRKNIFLVEQEGDLFAGSMQDNISLGEKNSDFEKVQKAAVMAELEEEILLKPGGYKFVLSHGGSGVSEGQRQRMLIARALYKDPAVLVLDEATSHLDPISEERVIERLLDTYKEKTMIFFTQRVHLTMKADIVIFLEDGKMIEMGSHKDLISKRKKYYDFFVHHLSLG